MRVPAQAPPTLVSGRQVEFAPTRSLSAGVSLTPSRPTSSDVPAAVPLSLLEAIRNLDTPLEDGLSDISPELGSRRLGLSSTVAAQIRRYQEQVAQAESVPADEAVSVFRLVGRRSDASLVFADAGRRAARYAADSSFARARARLGGRAARKGATAIARETFEAELRFPDPEAEVRLADPLSIRAWPDGQACGFYGAAFSELLRLITGFEGVLDHIACRGRGDHDCIWRGAPAEDYE